MVTRTNFATQDSRCSSRAREHQSLRFLLPKALTLLVISTLSNQAEAGVTACFGPAGTGLCPVGSSVCQVNSSITVDNNADLDCGTHDLVIANGLGKLTVNGKMTIRAHNLTVENTRSLEATSSGSVRASIVIDLTGSLSLWGQINARNTGPGSEIRVTADLDIVLQPRDGLGIDLIGVGQSVDGGELVLDADRDVLVGSKIHANGNDSTGSANRNSGGDISISAGDDIVVDHLIRAYGRWFSGGHMSLTAGDDVEINNDGATSSRRGQIDLEGHGVDGSGGVLDIRAGDRVLFSGPISLGSGVGNGGGEAQGGDVRIDAGCSGVRLEDSLNLLGGSMGGGNLAIQSRGTISVAGSITSNASELGGDGGDVSLRSSMGNVVLEGTASIRSNGHVTTNGADGVGGTVALHGCQVDVVNGAVVEATGKSNGRFETSSYKNGAALQGSFGIRISENADVSAFSTGGKIVLRTPTVLTGTCPNGSACQYDSDCTVGCSSGDCAGGNPQTDGQVVQFSSVPVVEQDSSLGPCAAACQ
jgi:hypothetical protein